MLENIYYQIFCFFITGMILGSFLNVVIFRTISNESIILPPSKCPHCNTSLLWWQNIPVISYFILKGRCFFCKEKIDIQYPIVEFISGMIFVISYLKFSLSLKMVVADISVLLFLALACMDVKIKKISVKLAVILSLSALIFNYNNIFSSLLAGGLIFLLICTLKIFLEKIFSKTVIGEGDVYVLVSMALFSGMKNVFELIILTLLCQLIFSMPSFIKDIFKTKNYKLFIYPAWFLLSYMILFASKLYIITPDNFIKILTIINLICSVYLFSKELYFRMKNNFDIITFPFSPAIFLAVFIYFCLV